MKLTTREMPYITRSLWLIAAGILGVSTCGPHEFHSRLQVMELRKIRVESPEVSGMPCPTPTASSNTWLIDKELKELETETNAFLLFPQRLQNFRRWDTQTKITLSGKNRVGGRGSVTLNIPVAYHRSRVDVLLYCPRVANLSGAREMLKKIKEVGVDSRKAAFRTFFRARRLSNFLHAKEMSNHYAAIQATYWWFHANAVLHTTTKGVVAMEPKAQKRMKNYLKMWKNENQTIKNVLKDRSTGTTRQKLLARHERLKNSGPKTHRHFKNIDQQIEEIRLDEGIGQSLESTRKMRRLFRRLPERQQKLVRQNYEIDHRFFLDRIFEGFPHKISALRETEGRTEAVGVVREVNEFFTRLPKPEREYVENRHNVDKSILSEIQEKLQNDST